MLNVVHAKKGVIPGSRFKLNVSAGSQKRTIHEPEGKDESRFSLKSKRNINVTIV